MTPHLNLRLLTHVVVVGGGGEEGEEREEGEEGKDGAHMSNRPMFWKVDFMCTWISEHLLNDN